MREICCCQLGVVISPCGSLPSSLDGKIISTTEETKTKICNLTPQSLLTHFTWRHHQNNLGCAIMVVNVNVCYSVRCAFLGDAAFTRKPIDHQHWWAWHQSPRVTRVQGVNSCMLHWCKRSFGTFCTTSSFNIYLVCANTMCVSTCQVEFVLQRCVFLLLWRRFIGLFRRLLSSAF